MNSRTPPKADGAQIKKIKKIPKSPEKYVVTGQTQNLIRSADSTQNIVNTSIQSKPVVDHTGLERKQSVLIKNLGYVYNGFTLNNTPHGEGSLLTTDGLLIFQGTWKNGSRNGYGHYIYSDGTQYKGDWVNNMKTGQGVFSNKAGQKYEGQWMENKRNGRGRLELGGGVILDGIWQNDEFVSGTVIYPDGGSYRGNMKNFQRNGQGIYTYPNKDKFQGQWVNNMKQGVGQYKHSNNDEFRGTFKDGLRQGINCQYSWGGESYEMINATFNKDKCTDGKAVKS